MVGGLLAGFSYSLWFQALTAEAYALNAFFAALVLFLVLRLGGEGPLGPSPTRRQRTLVLLLVGAYGLSCGNHPVTVVFLPAFAWLAWTQRAALRDRRLVAPPRHLGRHAPSCPTCTCRGLPARTRRRRSAT